MICGAYDKIKNADGFVDYDNFAELDRGSKMEVLRYLNANKPEVFFALKAEGAKRDLVNKAHEEYMNQLNARAEQSRSLIAAYDAQIKNCDQKLANLDANLNADLKNKISEAFGTPSKAEKKACCNIL